METELIQVGGMLVVRIVSEGVFVREPGDAMELIAACWEAEARHIVVDKECFDPAFFDLKTGLAGEVLQKFSTYRLFLAILGDFSGYTSKALADFIRESNRQGRILFVSDLHEAGEHWKK